MDWSIEWGTLNDQFAIEITVVEQALDQPYSTLTSMQIIGDERATNYFEEVCEANLDWVSVGIILAGIVSSPQFNDVRVILQDEKAITIKSIVINSEIRATLAVIIRARRMGTDTGRSVLLDIGNQFKIAAKEYKQRSRSINAEEQQKMAQIRARFL